MLQCPICRATCGKTKTPFNEIGLRNHISHAHPKGNGDARVEDRPQPVIARLVRETLLTFDDPAHPDMERVRAIVRSKWLAAGGDPEKIKNKVINNTVALLKYRANGQVTKESIKRLDMYAPRQPKRNQKPYVKPPITLDRLLLARNFVREVGSVAEAAEVLEAYKELRS